MGDMGGMDMGGGEHEHTDDRDMGGMGGMGGDEPMEDKATG